jgi:hypothetical protein
MKLRFIWELSWFPYSMSFVTLFQLTNRGIGKQGERKQGVMQRIRTILCA